MPLVPRWLVFLPIRVSDVCQDTIPGWIRRPLVFSSLWLACVDYLDHIFWGGECVDTAVVAVLILMVSECPVCFVTVPLSVTTDIVAFSVERGVEKKFVVKSLRVRAMFLHRNSKVVTNVIGSFLVWRVACMRACLVSFVFFKKNVWWFFRLFLSRWGSKPWLKCW